MILEHKASIQEYLLANKEQIVEDLRTVVKVPSFRSDPEPGCPFGPGPAAAVEAAAKLYEANGYQVERYPEDGYALARAGSGEKYIGVFCHCDVVPSETGGEWEHSDTPYDIVLQDDFVIGRGVKDNKGAVIGTLYALNALRASGALLKHSVLVFLGSNEETGMQDAIAFCEKHRMPDVSFVPDNAAPLCYGERGYCSFYFTCDKKLETIIDFAGGNRWSVVGEVKTVLPANAQLKQEIMEAIKDRTDAELQENEDGNLLLITSGIPAHPVAAYRSVNAGGVAAEILVQCPSLGENDIAIMTHVREMLCNVYGEYLGLAYKDEHFGDLTVCGMNIATKDGHVELLTGVCYQPIFTEEYIRETVMKKGKEIGWTYTLDFNDVGYLSSKDTPVVELVDGIYRALCEEENISPINNIYTSGAATYARRLKNAYGIGITIPASGVPKNFNRGHGGPHQPDECMWIPNYLEGILNLALILVNVDKVLEDL